MERIKFIITLAIFIIPLTMMGQTIKVYGDPVFPSNTFDLTEAGMDYTSTVTSSSGPTVDISHKNGWAKWGGTFNWKVYINKADLYWNQSLEIQVRRSGDGTGGSWFNNFISGGTNFQTVTNVPNYFFNGGAVRNDVPIEFRINNISVLIPADSYETTIYFTIYDN